MALDNAYRVRYGKGHYPAHVGWVLWMEKGELRTDPSSFYVYDVERGKVVKLHGTNRMHCTACNGEVTYGGGVIVCSSLLCKPYAMALRSAHLLMADNGVSITGLGQWTRIKLEQLVSG